MCEGTPVTEHIGEFNHIINQLKAIEYRLDDELLVHCLLLSMTKSWSTIVEIISAHEKLAINYIRDRIINEGVRGRERGVTSGDALNVQREREN